MKMILPDSDICGGCRTCEAICSFSHSGIFNPRAARISVIKDEANGVYFPLPCLQCREAYCYKACPVGAISVDEGTGAKIINPNACIGCRMCAIVCPFGGPVYDESNGKMTKCDLCLEIGEPQCVKWCPKGALKYVEVGQVGFIKKGKAAYKVMKALLEEGGV